MFNSFHDNQTNLHIFIHMLSLRQIQQLPNWQRLQNELSCYAHILIKVIQLIKHNDSVVLKAYPVSILHVWLT